MFIVDDQINDEQDNIPNYNSNSFENINSMKLGDILYNFNPKMKTNKYI